MKSLSDLEDLRSRLIDRFHDEGNILASWTSADIAKINEKAYKEEDWAWNDSWRTLKANAALLGALGTAISGLDRMIKDRQKKDPVKKDVAIDALEAIRGR